MVLCLSGFIDLLCPQILSSRRSVVTSFGGLSFRMFKMERLFWRFSFSFSKCSNAKKKPPESFGHAACSALPWFDGEARDLIPHLCPEQICDFGELLQTISPLPSHKFAQIFSAGLRQRFNYESETTTKLIMDSLRRLPRSPRNSQNLFSARCVVRGVLEVSQQLKLELLERLGGAMPIKSAPIDLQTSPQPLKTSPSSRVSIVMNWRRITKVFRDVYHQAQQKYASRMFLHWYLGRTQELSASFCMSLFHNFFCTFVHVLFSSFALAWFCFIPPHPSHLPRCLLAGALYLSAFFCIALWYFFGHLKLSTAIASINVRML